MLARRRHITPVAFALGMMGLWLLPIAEEPLRTDSPAWARTDGPLAKTHLSPHSKNALRKAGSAKAGAPQVFTVERMRATILDFVKKQLPGTHRVQIVVLHPEDPLTLPAGAVQVGIRALGPQDRLGRRSFELALQVGGRKVDRVRVLADVTARATVIAPLRLIRPHDTISAEDLSFVEVRLTSTTQAFVSDLDMVVGKRAIRPLRANAPIHASALAQPYAVRKGDRVTIEARGKGLVIQTVGITKAAGHIGQTVTVTNLDSKRDIRARVTAPGVVEVDF